MSDQVYLTNDLNPGLAGFYDAAEAAVYLNHSNGWREASPTSPSTPATPPAGSPPPGTGNPGDPADNETE